MKTVKNHLFPNIKILFIVGVLFFVSFTSMIEAGNQIENDIIINNSISYDYINENEIIINFRFSDLIQTQIETEFGEFTLLEIPNSGFTGEIGHPQIPMVTKIFAISTDDITYDVIESNILEKRVIDRLYPVQNPQTECEKVVNEFVFDESSYNQDENYPGKLIEILDTGNIRDIPFVKIGFYPIHYNPVQKTVTIYDQISIKIKLDSVEQLLMESKYTTKPFFNYYQNIFSNWDEFIINTNMVEKQVTREDGCDYLIITHDNFYNEAKVFGDWKHKQGYMTKIATTSETGSSYTQIRQYIQNAYDSWAPQPSYLLLIGDAEYVPTTYVYTAGTDLWYATVDGSDYYADLFYGRIPADNTNEAEVMIEKILNYETSPPDLASFYENFVVAAYFQDDENNGYETRRFVRTSEEVRDYLQSIGYIGERIYCTEPYINPTNYNNGYYGNGEPLPADLLRPGFAWDGDGNDIINAIEQGIFILNHRDHGMESGWGDPYFTTSDFNSIENGDLLPVVFSINCLTGRFDGYECFCEEFLRKDDGGVVAAFGATRVSYSGYNDYLCRGFYDAMWPDFDTQIGDDISMMHLGEVLNYGKAYMADTWGNPWGYERYTFELFHVFGDPSLDLFTALPESMDVTYQFVGDEIKVTVQDNGNAIEKALVCVSQEGGCYDSGLTGDSGIIYLDISDADENEEITLVVTAHNYLYNEMNFNINQQPLKPEVPSGPDVGKPNTEYMFSTSTTDPEDDRISYNFSWGDGTYSGWVGPFDSGETGCANHKWESMGTFEIKVKAMDTKGAESEWSDPIEVRMPKINIENYHFLNLLLERFPNAFPLIRYLFGF